MFAKLLTPLCLLALFSPAFSQNNMTGTLTWVSGTLVNPITIEDAPITLVLRVGDRQDTLANTFVTGLPGTNLPAGTQMEFLDHASVPFAGLYAGGDLNAIVFNPADGHGTIYRRTVPITLQGALAYSVATVAGQPGGELEFYLPYVQVSWPTSFFNDVSIWGLTLIFGVPVASYSLAVPTSSVYATSTVNFPPDSAAMNIVDFSCQGNCQLTFHGASKNSLVEVTGNLVFLAGNGFQGTTIINGATLSFLSGQ